jgi:hypothetical protein
LTGVAVKVADAPSHPGLVPDVSAMDTAGVNDEFTVIVITFELAVDVLTVLLKIIFGLTDPVPVPVAWVQEPVPPEPSIW